MKMRQWKQNQKDNKHCNFSLKEVAAKIALDNLLRNETAPHLPVATNENKNVSWIHLSQVPPDLSIQSSKKCNKTQPFEPDSKPCRREN